MANEVKINLFDLGPDALTEFFISEGDKPFRATQIMKWAYQRGVIEFDKMTDLGKALRARLAERAQFVLPEVAMEQKSSDGTRKWLLRLADGNCIETVFIPEDDRGTLCISSQVGCILNCSFCSTAQQGFNRNLTAGEIIGQLWLAAKSLGQFDNPTIENRVVTNVVLMGMGEPLLNFDNVVSALGLMLDDNAFGLSKRRVTLSTAGVVPGIDRLCEVTDVSLAISLHATRDELRNELVPLNRKYPIREVLAACKRYIDDKPARKITVEYVLLNGVNDEPAHARELVRLLEGIPAKVNLIPFNPFPNTRYVCSTPERKQKFYDVLFQAGLTTITRRTRGDDIDAACGQLAGRVADKTRRTVKVSFLQAEGDGA